MKNKETKLFVNPLYSIIISYVVAITFLLFIAIPKIMKWENEPVFWAILYYSMFSALSIYFFYYATIQIQFAILCDDKIIIKDLFHVIAELKKDEIYIKIESLLTYDSREIVFLDYFVIRTDQDQTIKRYRPNKKGRFPMLILANKKNEPAMIEFMKKDEPNKYKKSKNRHKTNRKK